MQGVQIFYIHAQMFLSSYNAIYGSFAALPLFMLWLQISWTICLFGVELCYTNQNLDYYDYDVTDIHEDVVAPTDFSKANGVSAPANDDPFAPNNGGATPWARQ